MKKLTLDQLFGILRHILTIVGTVLVVAGSQIAEGQWEMITGAVLGLAASLWSVFSKPDTTTLKTEIESLKTKLEAKTVEVVSLETKLKNKK